MIGSWTFGRIALTLAIIDLAIMAISVFGFDSGGWLLPLFPPFSLLYWSIAAGAVIFGIAALVHRQWIAALGTGAILAVTLVPLATLFYQCARGNCL